MMRVAEKVAVISIKSTTLKGSSLQRRVSQSAPGGVRPCGADGFTLIEIIVVISLIAVVYLFALPNLKIKSGTEAASKIGRLASDVRAAFDLAVLNRKPFRLVFHMASGDYWLETTDRDDFYMGDGKLNRDMTSEEEKAALIEFEENFKEYEALAGQEIDDPENERVIKPTSPVLNAKARLAPVKWTMVENKEWTKRSLGPYFLVQDMWAEHHIEKQTLENLEREGRVILYFFPNGYVERAVMHIALRKGDYEIDTREPPYTIKTNPYSGTVEVTSGYEEVNLFENSR